MSTRATKRHWALALVGLAALTQAVFVLVLPQPWRANNSYDFISFYGPVAENVASGRGLTLEGELAVRYPPGYPAVLAGVYIVADQLGVDRGLALRILVVLTTALSALLVFNLALQSIDLRTARLATILFATYPAHLWITKQPNSENVLLPVFLAAVLLFLCLLRAERRRFVLAIATGALCGLAALVKPISIGVGALFSLIVLVRQPHWTRPTRLRLAASLLAANVAVWIPWEIGALAATGSLIPLGTAGASTIRDGLTFAVIPGVDPPPAYVSARLLEFMQSLHAQASPDSLASIGGALVTLAGDNPLTLLELFLLKAGRAWFATNMRWYEGTTVAIQLPYLCLALWGFVLMRRLPGREVGHFRHTTALLVIYFWAVTVVALSILRYMTPVMPLLLITASLPLLAFHSRSRPHRKDAAPLPRGLVHQPADMDG
ncbi:MAG: glycosyltransferase family 39 protein [Planctomycetota bacterium]